MGALTIEVQLHRFIREAGAHPWPSRTWLYSSEMDVYVRCTKRILDRERTTLDLASISVPEELQGKGIFSRLVNFAVAVNPREALFMESVINPILTKWCIKHGWLPAGDPARPTGYYLLMEA